MADTDNASNAIETNGSSAVSGEAEAELPALPEVIEKIGWGRAQVIVSLVGGSIWLCDGAELLLISSVTAAVAEEWDMSAFMQGLVVTFVYFGILVGNLASGPGGSYFGRRELVITSYFGIVFFSILCSWAQSTLELCVWRTIVGAFIGIGQPAFMAIGSEVTPASWRIIAQCLTQSLFAFGEVYACLLLIQDDPSLQNLHWRRLLQLGAIPPAVMLILSVFFMIQSPTFLAMKGRYEEAKEVLDDLRVQNRAGDISVDFKKLAPTSQQSDNSMLQLMARQGKVIASNKYLAPTLVLMYTCFITNLLYYGCLFAFPQVLPDLVDSGAATQLLLGALSEIPAFMFGCFLGVSCFRKTAIKFFLVCAAAFLLIFIIGANNVSKSPMFMVPVYIGYYGVKMTPNIGFITVYQVINEIYPTEARTMGSGICLAGGRAAAMIAPLMYAWTVEMTGTWIVYFLVMAAGSVLNLYLIDVVPETSGKLLTDDSDEETMEPEKLHGDKAAD